MYRLFSDVDRQCFRTFGLHPLFKREQGLLRAPGNPRGISGVADLTRDGVRYVNRQTGSGARDWFDRVLTQAGLEPGAIRGYAV